MNNAQEWHPLFFNCNKKKKRWQKYVWFLDSVTNRAEYQGWKKNLIRMPPHLTSPHLTFKKSHRKLNITGGQTQFEMLLFVVSAWWDNMEPLASTWVWRQVCCLGAVVRETDDGGGGCGTSACANVSLRRTLLLPVSRKQNKAGLL